jgi:hypothetical protein
VRGTRIWGPMDCMGYELGAAKWQSRVDNENRVSGKVHILRFLDAEKLSVKSVFKHFLHSSPSASSIRFLQMCSQH